jgi:hypothetical protein
VRSKTYEVVSRISEDEWRSIALELERHALSVSRNLRWRTRNALELPGGETVDSIVSKAIEKLFFGERDWDPETQPDLRAYLKGVIDSLLNHLAVSQENRLLTLVPEPGSKDASAWERGSSKRDPVADWLVPSSRSPEAAVIFQEQTALEDRALELLIDECAVDAILIAVLEAMMDGIETPAEISKAKGIPVQDIYNATKRLDRKLELIRKRIASEQNTPAVTREGV